MFEKTFIDLGTIKQKVEVVVEFSYSNIYLIDKFESSCDCQRIYNLSRIKVVQVKYIPKEIPTHLKTQGWYETTKTVKVFFTNDNVEKSKGEVTLQFKAKVVL